MSVVLERPAQPRDALVVVFGDDGLVCRKLVGLSQRLPNAHDWLARLGDRQPQHRRYLLDCLGRPGFADGKSASLLRELQVLSPGLQDGCLRATAELIVRCHDGLFVSGRLFDPHRLVEAMIIERDGAARTVQMRDVTIFRAPESTTAPVGQKGFAFFVDERDHDIRVARAPVRLSLGLYSGARLEFGEGPTLVAPGCECESVLGSIPADQLYNEALFALVEIAVRALLSERLLATPMRFEITDLGELPAHPFASIVIPFNPDPELLRCRTSLFSLDPSMADVEIVYLADSPEQYLLAEQMLLDFRSVYRRSLRILTPDRALPQASLLNAGLRATRGTYIAFLGSGVIPESTGWFPKLISFLKGHPQCGVVGGQALYDDHSQVAVGLFVGTDDLGRWALRPRLSGFPRDYPSASIPTRVAALSADCLVTSRSLLQESGGLAEDYFLGESACADLCLRVRTLGREVWRLPEPALFRIDRQPPVAVEAHLKARVEFDRRALERHWRQSLDAEFGLPERSAPSLRLPPAGEASTPSQKAA